MDFNIENIPKRVILLFLLSVQIINNQSIIGIEKNFIQAKQNCSPGVQSPPRKKALWGSMVSSTVLYLVKTEQRSNMTEVHSFKVSKETD